MEALLDPNKFDVKLLQQVVEVCFANKSNPVKKTLIFLLLSNTNTIIFNNKKTDRAVANHILTELKLQAFFYQKVPSIVDSAVHEHVKVRIYFHLFVLINYFD